MSFIDDGLAMQPQVARRKTLIEEGCCAIYVDLWERMKAYIEEAKQKGFELSSSGSLYHRKVERLLPPGSARPRDSFTLDLRCDEESIGTHGANRGMKFILSFDVLADGLVCLKHNGEPIQTDEAAVLMLRQFLFPELCAPVSLRLECAAEID
jgi:hypothetical protein